MPEGHLVSAPPLCQPCSAPQGQAEGGGMVLVTYAGPVRPAAALRDSVLCLPTDIHSLFVNKPSSSSSSPPPPLLRLETLERSHFIFKTINYKVNFPCVSARESGKQYMDEKIGTERGESAGGQGMEKGKEGEKIRGWEEGRKG